MPEPPLPLVALPILLATSWAPGAALKGRKGAESQRDKLLDAQLVITLGNLVRVGPLLPTPRSTDTVRPYLRTSHGTPAGVLSVVLEAPRLTY